MKCICIAKDEGVDECPGSCLIAWSSTQDEEE
jgi:hypothetical protein